MARRKMRRRGRRPMMRRRRRGFGSIITVRRGLGMGRGWMAHALPSLIGGGVAGLTTLGLRWFIDPNRGPTQTQMVKWAPLLGGAAGVVASLALFMMGGAPAGTQALTAAAIVAALGQGSDFVLKEKGGSVIAAIASSPTAMAAMAAGNNAGAAGVGAIVPEYSRGALSGGTGAIVMEPVGRSGQRAGTIGSYGETVSLSGVNTGAFGTPGFSA